jgi:hypothetical protein
MRGKFCFGKPEGSRPVGKSKRRWEGNCKTGVRKPQILGVWFGFI